MNFRKLLAGLLLSAFTLAVSAAEPEAKKHDHTSGKFHPMRNTSIQGDRRFGLRK